MSGSVAGNSMGDFGEMDGMAPDAKISFFDIGMILLPLFRIMIAFRASLMRFSVLHDASVTNMLTPEKLSLT